MSANRLIGLAALCCVVGLSGASEAGLPPAAPPGQSDRATEPPDPTLTAQVLSHGPWPANAAERDDPGDPGNRAWGKPAAIALGKRLFSDARLSVDGRVSCAGCHDPTRGFADGLPRALGLARHDRNTIGLAGVAGQRWYGWDGGADSLWAASIRPILAPGEMGGSAEAVARLIRADAGLMSDYLQAFGVLPAEHERVLADVGKALAAYLGTLAAPRTAFDRFRDALARGDREEVGRYPVAARRGLAIFLGEGRCAVCHAGPRFSNGEFHDIGRPFIVEPGRVDPGRHAGIRRVIADRFNLLGLHADREVAGGDAGGPPGARDDFLHTRSVKLEHRNWGEWKTPTLRGLTATAPYMHDGSLATLRDVVRHYSELDPDRLHVDGENLLRPLGLDEARIDDLVAFLESLSNP